MSITDLTVEEIDELMAVAEDIIANPVKYQDSCRHKLLATLFFEPSTRTRLSFETAINRLGGRIIGFTDASSSSVTKGETLKDTIIMVSNDTAQVVGSYVDIIAMRHPKEGAPVVAARRAGVPIINAGDGSHNHPTQTLTDLLTIKRTKNRFDNLTIGLCGDLKFGRTVHSLVEAMARYTGVQFVFISPDELKFPRYIIEDELDSRGIPYKEVSTLEEVMPELDVLYMTRIQRERFDDPFVYERLKDSYILDTQKMKAAKETMRVLHPLPRVNEISVKVDDDPRACYFFQALCGKHIRMALILKLLGIKKEA